MNLFRSLAFAVVALLAAAAPAHAEVRVDVNRGRAAPLPIAITNFAGDPAGADIARVITNDLAGSGLFKPLDPASFIQTPEQIQQKGVEYAAWKPLNVPALVTGQVVPSGDGRIRVEFRLHDVFAGASSASGGQIIGTAFTTAPQNWRRTAHIIADTIYKQLTGESGYFDTRVVYVAESGPGERRIKRLAIMDYDGENARYLTDGSQLVLTPRFSPTAAEVTYMAFGNGKPRVFLFNVDTQKRELLADLPQMTFSPRFSPDGNSVVFSMSENGQTDIYVMDLRSRQIRQLTQTPSIDTSPSYSPDGSKIVFESDRGGTQQLYVMSATGGPANRISFGDGRYAGPVWSPRGDLIAFTKQQGGQFFIGVMKPDGSGERLITQAFHVEGPTWAPNGRVLMYFKERPGPRGKTARLYTIDVTGQNEREVLTQSDASDPAWSGLLP
ncbi:Tol-Pal system beta propeller repeat protein TolB [Roseiterribacter gracilis]|uniref:Tol-Pal system protein TolB n=1 Tax=Roseiterribacter gracilis TaxID=2812848 RepID=A0A8S8XE63_9PROT|nr:protein TolB [Rhodospirillales bacterium TMPK1]